MFNFIETPTRNAVNDADHLQIENVKYMINGGSLDLAESMSPFGKIMADHQQNVNAIAAAAATEQKPRRIEDFLGDMAVATPFGLAAAVATEQKPRQIEDFLGDMAVATPFGLAAAAATAQKPRQTEDVLGDMAQKPRRIEDVLTDMTDMTPFGHQQKMDAIAAATATEQKLRRWEDATGALGVMAPKPRRNEDVLTDMTDMTPFGHQQKVDAIAAAAATEQKLRRWEDAMGAWGDMDQKPRHVEATGQKSSQVVQTQTNSIMVGFQVKPDNKYLDHHRVNRINNLLTTFQTASCSFLIQNADHVLDKMFNKQATVHELDCDEALRMADRIYNERMSNLHSRGDRQLIIPMLTLGYGLFTDMIRDTCDANNKITRESVSESAKALLKVACNVPQF
jgi:hypothetical protein